ncbi:hypothetical protein H0H93_007864 [Arthromyces matolae]|nr:hypothetical protein H0H93_007864 [Arthromyces matolae]
MVKTCLRFTLLIITQKPLLHLPIPEREFDPVSLASSGDALSQTPSFESSKFSRAYPEHLNNNNTPFPPHDLLSPRAETGAEEYLLPKALTTSSVKPYLSLVKSLSSPTDWIAESLYILRPLIYGVACLILLHLAASLDFFLTASLLISNPRSNRSIIITLSVELAARWLRRTPLPSATLERAEYARRLGISVKLQTLATAASQTPTSSTQMSPIDTLPKLRRIVTGHDAEGKSTVENDRELLSEVPIISKTLCWFVAKEIMQPMSSVEGAQSASIWVTSDSIPTDDNNNHEDGANRVITDPSNFGLVQSSGTNLRTTELAPGARTPMHRTSSLDYNILVEGELILIMEDGTEKRLKGAGDTVIQKGTMHAWKNPGKKWARWITVLIAAEPAIVDGKSLAPAFIKQ